MSTAIDFSKKSLVIITGASQGIGQTIAVVVGSKVATNSKVILIARSQSGLLETKKFINEANKNVSVEIHSLDLSSPDVKAYTAIFDKIIQTGDAFENGIIFHNAGQVGKLDNTTELNDLQMWREYYDLNMFSTALLNSTFIKSCKKFITQLYVINISSLCGHKPFKNMAMYGSAKAARDMYFSVLAVEEPNVVVLKYCPGPVLTAMFNEVITSAQNDEIKSQFKKMRDNKSALSTSETVDKLLMILEMGKFKSGDLLDYFDV